MVTRGSQVGAVLVAVSSAALMIACDSPARVKPWRHAPDPTTEAARAPASPVLEPSLWARRILIGTVFEPLLRYVPPDAQGPARFTGRLARSWRVMPNGV